MKRFSLTYRVGLMAAALLLVVAQGASAQEMPPRDNSEARPSPNASVSQTVGTTVVTINYGRPGVKGRDVFGGLVPYGEVWRAGANEATVMAFSDDVTVNGEPLAAGAYAFFVIPQEEGAWSLIFNSTAQQWGAFRRNPENDVLTVTAEPETAAAREWMMFHFEDVGSDEATAVLHWDTVRLPFTIAAAD